jgi:GNAT superfamily N-acetyltransferase
LEIVKAGLEDISVIQEIADRTWKESFRSLLPQDQISYMLQLMYSTEVISLQIEGKNQVYLLISDEDQFAGFASYEADCDENNHAKLHKLFILPELQRSSAGTLLLEEVIRQAKEVKNDGLLLNVNRQSNAVEFYLDKGFTIEEEDDISIGNGYTLRDYIMRLDLT